MLIYQRVNRLNQHVFFASVNSGLVPIAGSQETSESKNPADWQYEPPRASTPNKPASDHSLSWMIKGAAKPIFPC